jgi:hypothetical protein
VSDEQQQSQALVALTDREQRAYERYLRDGEFPLGAALAASLYALFIQGYTTDEIQRQNPGLKLGSIVRARLDYGWDEHRRVYRDGLLAGVQARITQAHLEGVKFACDGLAVFQRLAGDRFRRFLQSGDAAELGPWQTMSFKTYKELLEMLLKLTGQDVQRVKAEVFHRQDPQAPAEDQALTPAEAAEGLRLLDAAGGVPA